MKKLIAIFLAWLLVFTAFYMANKLVDEDSCENRLHEQRLLEPDPPLSKRAKGWDFTKQDWYYYSDSEIQKLREIQSYNPDGKYIYTPGRYVPSREEEIEDYIEDHWDEIMDEYGN